MWAAPLCGGVPLPSHTWSTSESALVSITATSFHQGLQWTTRHQSLGNWLLLMLHVTWILSTFPFHIVTLWIYFLLPHFSIDHVSDNTILTGRVARVIPVLSSHSISNPKQQSFGMGWYMRESLNTKQCENFFEVLVGFWFCWTISGALITCINAQPEKTFSPPPLLVSWMFLLFFCHVLCHRILKAQKTTVVFASWSKLVQPWIRGHILDYIPSPSILKKGMRTWSVGPSLQLSQYNKI